MTEHHMRSFWDARAREDPYYFVDNSRAYRSSELESFWAGGERDLRRLLEVLELRLEPDAAVVEIGCGVGRLTRAIADRAARISALDVSPEMIAKAGEHNPGLKNVEWLVCDGRSLRPLPDASYDACISHVVFQHIPDPDITLAYVSEMARVLRPGGWAAFQLSNDPRPHRRTHGLRSGARRLAAALGWAPRGRHDPAWLGSAVQLGDLRRAAGDGGLEVERIVAEGTQFCAVRLRK
jgi:SAM-dependent methyltransferase